MTRRIIGSSYSSLLLAAMAWLALTPGVSRAQSGFFSSFGTTITDARMNVQLDDFTEPAQPHEVVPVDVGPAVEEPALEGLMMHQPSQAAAPERPRKTTGQAEPAPLVAVKELNVAYSYLFKNEKAPADFEVSVHSVVPELFLRTGSGLAIRPKLLYFHAGTDMSGASFTEADAFGGGLALSQELLHPFHPRHLKVALPTLELSANVEVGYRDTNVDFTSPAIPDSDFQSLSASSGLTLLYHAVQTATSLVNLALTSTFQYEEKRSVVSSVRPAEAQLLAVEGRGDVLVNKWLVISAKMSWYHDLLLTVASAPDPENEDWMAFELVPIVILGRWHLRTAVSYEAFHSDYSVVRITEQIAYNF